jgi:four helix bundle protein
MWLAMTDVMRVTRVEELIAWQPAVQMKVELYRLVNSSLTAARDFKFRDQLFDAASGAEMTIAEGFRRFHAPQIIQFFTFARASLEETKRWLHDGEHRGHFLPAMIHDALRLVMRCDIATLRFMQGLLRTLPPEEQQRDLARTQDLAGPASLSARCASSFRRAQQDPSGPGRTRQDQPTLAARCASSSGRRALQDLAGPRVAFYCLRPFGDGATTCFLNRPETSRVPRSV